jgi:hypothetical protein
METVDLHSAIGSATTCPLRMNLRCCTCVGRVAVLQVAQACGLEQTKAANHESDSQAPRLMKAQKACYGYNDHNEADDINDAVHDDLLHEAESAVKARILLY